MSLRKKVLVTIFVLFHFACVVGWVFPGAPGLRRIVLAPTLPVPVLHSDPGQEPRWTVESVPVVSAWLQKTGQWQHWNLFAPNPMFYHRHLAARIATRSGALKEVTLPRLGELGVVGAHLEARYREYQYGLTGPERAVEDLARWVARSLNDPADPAVLVSIYAVQMTIPPHDRPELRPGTPVDYPALLRDPARFTRILMLEYRVKPEDLP